MFGVNGLPTLLPAEELPVKANIGPTVYSVLPKVFIVYDILQVTIWNGSFKRVKRFEGAEMKLSGLQKEVLSLYRKCLRAIRQKPMVSQYCLRSDLIFRV